MRIVLFGGTFDPWTDAHQEITEALAHKFDLVLVIPTMVHYYKSDGQMFSFEQRACFAREHTARLKNVDVLELEKNADENWRFIDTLKSVRSLYGNQNDYYTAIGSDSLQKFTTWTAWQEILKLSALIVFNRPGYTKDFPDIPYEYLEMDNKISSTQVRQKLRDSK